MKTLLTLLCTAAAASAYGQTASTFAQRYEAIYSQAGNTLNTFDPTDRVLSKLPTKIEHC